jgi:hypothetical protein
MNPPTYPGFISTPLDFSGLPPLRLTEDPIFVTLFVDSLAEMSFVYSRHFMSWILQTDTLCSIEYYFDLIKVK